MLTASERWQKEHGLISKSYKLNKKTVEEFALACQKANISQAKQLTKMMQEFTKKNNCNNKKEEI